MGIRSKAARRTVDIRLYDALGKELYNGELSEMAVPEDVVLSLSKLYFNDPNPCYIHRGAVLFRMFEEIELALEVGRETPTDALSDDLAAYFGVYSPDSVVLTVNEP